MIRIIDRPPVLIAAVAVTFLTGAGGGGIDPAIFGLIALVLFAAKIAGDLFARIGQPSVMGELIAGVVLGNLGLAGYLIFSENQSLVIDHNLELLAEVGVIILLFQVGLESNLTELARTGVSSLAVALAGVVAPVALGYGVHALLVTDATWHTHLFVGAILAATSVGITARVLQELGKIDSPTGRVILGAAVIDDVLGLILLAVVAGIVAAAGGDGGLDTVGIAIIAGKAIGFLAIAIALGQPAARHLFRLVKLLEIRGLLVAFSLAFCMVVAWGSAVVGLHPIVGAFAAGLVLDEVHYRDVAHREKHGLEHAIEDIGAFLIPIFFVVTGAKVDVTVLADTSILLLAGLLTLVAIVGKQVCSLFAFGDGVNKLAVGLGMIPRGEVGLIFANVGAATLLLGQPVVDASTYAAVVIMVLITTMVTPPLLAMSLRERESG